MESQQYKNVGKSPLQGLLSKHLLYPPNTFTLYPEQNTRICPALGEYSVWVLLHPTGLRTLKSCQTGPTVYSHYTVSEKTRESNH